MRIECIKPEKGCTMRYLFMCKSLTYAQRASRLLERAGLYNSIIKSPAELSSSGCGYSLSIRLASGVKAAELLRKNQLLGKVFLQNNDGSFREVTL